jgi:excisionase family DNA binding protein
MSSTTNTDVVLALPAPAVEAIAQRAAAILAAQHAAADDDRWMTTSEAAAYIGAQPRRVRDLVERGVLPHGRDGTRLLVRRSALDA